MTALMNSTLCCNILRGKREDEHEWNDSFSLDLQKLGGISDTLKLHKRFNDWAKGNDVE